MTTIRATGPQGATFVELFFDLVFVFAVTQVTGLLVHDLTPQGLLQALIVFWLVWWAWTQFTWSLNEADTEHVTVRIVTLASTGLAFLMAVTVATLTGPWGWLFALSYLVLRALGIGIQWRLASGDDTRLGAVRIWTLTSSLGLVAVAIAAFVDSEQRFFLLGIAALLDVFAALRAGRGEWHIYPGHFSERHGLFMIIVLGESLIAAGVAATGQDLTLGLVVVTILAVVGSCAVWWTYFGWAKEALEKGLARQPAARVGRYARDVFSFAHFPLIFGVIGFAVGIEEAVAHPGDPLPLPASIAIGFGVAAILGANALALRLAGSGVPMVRWLAALALVAGIPVLRLLPAWGALSVISAVVILVAVGEGEGPEQPSLERA